MTFVRAFAAAVLAGIVGLAGCASGSAPKPTPLQPIKASIAGRVAWSQRVEGASFPLAVSAQAGRFIVAGSDGSVLALDVDDGRVLWRVNVGAPITAGVGSDGRYTSVVTRNNEVVTLDGAEIRWRQRVPSSVSTAPLVAGERVFVMAVDRSIEAFDAVDGRRLWRLQRPGEALTLAQSGVLVPFRDTLLAGQGSRLAALDPLRGTVRWELPLATPRGTNEVERLADLVGPPVRLGSVYCMRAFQQAVGCLDVERIAPLWSKSAGGTQAIGGDRDRLIGADGTDRITAWRTGTGEVLWSNDRYLYRGLSGAAVVGPTVVFGDVEGMVHWLAADNGEALLRLPTDGSPVVGTPVLSGTTLLVVTRRGGIFAFRPV